ncbi:hypothetical protein [Konateibacter massiliensis]|uniref:hypothetical protein n=1 Tax=Konateibacter massiliensis TaxID=2002841 RepID=UPI000C157136|nr:hypothetical protein [Konateibacter massiliensis]
MSDIYLCTKCGYFKFFFKKPESCNICDGDVVEITTLDDYTFAHMTDTEKEQFAINYVGHDFDPVLKNKRIDYDANRRAEIRENSNKFEATHPECPYCHGRDTKKITTTAKAINTVVFGLLGTKRHKQFHCNNCKSDF